MLCQKYYLSDPFHSWFGRLAEGRKETDEVEYAASSLLTSQFSFSLFKVQKQSPPYSLPPDGLESLLLKGCTFCFYEDQKLSDSQEIIGGHLCLGSPLTRYQVIVRQDSMAPHDISERPEVLNNAVLPVLLGRMIRF